MGMCDANDVFCSCHECCPSVVDDDDDERSAWLRGYDDGYAADPPADTEDAEYMDGYWEGYSEQN